MHLPPANIEIDILIGDHAGESFADSAAFREWVQLKNSSHPWVLTMATCNQR